MHQEVCFNQGTEAGGGGELMWATRSAPPVILFLLRAWITVSYSTVPFLSQLARTDLHTFLNKCAR